MSTALRRAECAVGERSLQEGVELGDSLLCEFEGVGIRRHSCCTF